MGKIPTYIPRWFGLSQSIDFIDSSRFVVRTPGDDALPAPPPGAHTVLITGTQGPARGFLNGVCWFEYRTKETNANNIVVFLIQSKANKIRIYFVQNDSEYSTRKVPVDKWYQ